MEHLLHSLQKSEKYRKVSGAISNGGGIRLSGLAGSSKELLLASIAEEFNKPILYVVRGPKEQDISAGNFAVFSNKAVYQFPALDFSAGEGFKPQIEITSERVEILCKLLMAKDAAPVVIATAHSVTQTVIPPAELRSLIFEIKKGSRLGMEKFRERLVADGYEPVSMVEKKGDFSVRGGIVDVYSITDDDPYRFEFFGDEVESIRHFEPFGQKSTGELAKAVIVPCNELSLLEKNASATVFDYLRELLPDPVVVFDEFLELKDMIGQFSPVFSESKIFVSLYQFIDKIGGCRKLFFNLVPQTAPEFPGIPNIDFDVRCVENIARDSRVTGRDSRFLVVNTQDSILRGMSKLIDDKFNVTVVCNNEGEKERYRELIKEKGFAELEELPVAIHRLNSGFIIPEIKCAIIADQDIFNRYKIRAAAKRFKGVNPLSELTEINEGDYVVHINFGIGRYRGLKMMEKDGLTKEFLAIEYAEKSMLYVPVENVNLVERYIGIGKRPTLDKLGSARWSAVKKRVEIATAGMAADLLEVQAAREALQGNPFSKDTQWQRDFEGAFIYEETPDQIRTIEEVKKDMESNKPMDRLICGDVGYGKTEVAVRAAFKAVMDNRQVAVLVPTTILADQHFRTFSERMQDYPVKIEMLSRFKTKKEQKKVLEELKDGKVNIVIGTHRLLQKDVAFKDIGLVIIDEEQRFGVRHKEKFKQLRKLIDVLTLTATPIPRTLYMSLLGVKEMSTINTPPENRLPIETYIVEYDDNIIRKAVIHELAREGQVFFVHNRIQTIERVKERLQKLVPEAKIMTAHGRMDEDELAEIMHMFVNGKIDVLLSTTIIESGLDIPNANTIIIDRADRFGLAELYQLRGRVGRYNIRAYAYILFPRDKVLIEAARKRLRALSEFSGIGSGFKLAMRDLEIRGTGNILGKEQHGHIAAVGFDLYCRLLKQNILRLKDIPLVPERDVIVKLGFPPAIPLSYVGDESLRIDLYKRLGNVTSPADVSQMEDEIRDRFGPLPEKVKILLEISAMKVIARAKGIDYIELKDGKLILKKNSENVMFEGRHARVQGKTPLQIAAETIRILDGIPIAAKG